MRMLLPRRSVRLRLTALYTVLFLLSGAVLLAIISGVVGCGRNASHGLRSRLTTMRASVDVAVAEPRSVRSHSRRALGEVSDGELVAFVVS